MDPRPSSDSSVSSGQLAGKTGSFVLQRTGVFEGGQAKESYSVVAGSATGELSGLRGEGQSAVGHGLGASLRAGL